MEGITLGQIAVAVALVVGLVSGFAYLYTMMKKWLKTAFRDDFDKIDSRITDIEERLVSVNMEASKNFLVQAFASLERDGEMDETTKERVYECYDRYIKAGGNSYIKRRMEQLQQEGKL